MTDLGMDAGKMDSIAMIAINTDTGVMGTSTMAESIVDVVKKILVSLS